MENYGLLTNRVGNLLIQTNGDSNHLVEEDDEEIENSPVNFQLAFSDIYHGGPAVSSISTQITNGNTKCKISLNDEFYHFDLWINQLLLF